MNYYFDDYKKGALDTSGRKIEEITEHKENEYIIYFAENDYTNVQFNDGKDSNIEFSSSFQNLMAKLDLLNAENVESNKFIRENISDALIKELNGHSVIACSILEKTISQISESQKINNFCIFLKFAGTSVAVLSIVTILAYLNIIFPENFDKSLKNGLYCIEFSTLGSLLYHLSNINQSNSSTQIAPKRQAIFTFIRSSLSGILIYMIILSDILLGAFHDNIAAMCVISFISGFNKDIPLKLIGKIAKTIE